MVFLAKQSALQSSLHVAIKFIPKQTIYDSKGLSKTQQVCHWFATVTNQAHDVISLLISQEMNALQMCDHPFITHCFGGFDVSVHPDSV